MNTKLKTQKIPSRESETRVKKERRKPWTPPSALEAPPAPTGFSHRWIRAEVLGFQDTKNVSARLREGWEFVRADEYPDGQFPQIDTGQHKGVIGVGGLLLARIPTEIIKERKAYFDQITQDKDDAVEHDLMKERHPSMPIHADRQSRVTFGGGQKK
jgi:hypothetical protein|tara:strand:+ start:957 stop:1427 length:471 start_codon:yes stop_codon:yes gene_type:complete